MLAQVHRTFEVVGVHLSHAEGRPIRATVRIHRKPAVDRLSFGDFSDAAGSLISEDTIVFDLATVPRPMPDTFFIVSRSEGYRLGPAKPPQSGYSYVTVNEMEPRQISDLLERAAADPADPIWLGVI